MFQDRKNRYIFYNQDTTFQCISTFGADAITSPS